MNDVSADPRWVAILPAAGLSRRMGTPKLQLPWEQKTILQQVVDTWLSSDVREIYVVLRAEDHSLREVCLERGVQVVIPDAPPPEMIDSIRAGLAAISRTASHPTGWLVAPADTPTLARADIHTVVQAYDVRRPAIVVPTHGGRGGHPILLPWALAAEVQQLAAHETLRDLLARQPVTRVPARPQVLEDLDTPDDYRRLRGRDAANEDRSAG